MEDQTRRMNGVVENGVVIGGDAEANADETPRTDESKESQAKSDGGGGLEVGSAWSTIVAATLIVW
jgi:hypothetical protein